MKTFIHIGMHKTGSTSIQKYLQANRKAFAVAGVDIPDFAGNRGPKSHAILCEHFKQAPNLLVTQWLSSSVSARVARVISSEDMCQYDEQAISRLRQAVGCSATIICFVRDPVDHLISMYKQHAKSDDMVRIKELTEFIKKRARADPSSSYYNYDARTELWSRYFKDFQNVAYSRSALNTFCDLGDLPVIDGAIFPAVMNASPSPIVTEVIRRITRMVAHGVISISAAVRLKTGITAKPDQCEQLFSEDMPLRPVDMSKFHRAFLKASPKCAEQFGFTRPPSPLMWPQEPSISDFDMLRCLREMQTDANPQ